MGSQEKNSENVAAALAYQNQNKGARREITYEQSNQLVLLGSGHDQADHDRIDNQPGDWNHSGRMTIRVDQEEKKIKVLIVPEDRKGSMAELEQAVRNAIQGMKKIEGMTEKELQAIKQLPVMFSWQ
jgi:hypothetical protein